MIALCLFWFCVGALSYSYILYPLLLKIFSSGKKENDIVFSPGDNGLPTVYVLMSVYNEEKVIRQKVESVFNTSYPLDKLKVHIGSDNSTDGTDNILRELSIKYPQLSFTSFSQRQGKPNVLGKLVSAVKHEATDILIFTDANVIFSSDTIYHLAKHFKNNSISQVGANILNKGMTADGISVQENSYIRIENNIKYLEGLNWGTMIGAFGACYAIRADAWTPIPSNFIVDDFFLSMNILAKGQKAILEEKAICYEDVSNEVANEFNRKARIQSGNFQNLATFWKLLFRFNALSFCFFSHKVIRWTGPLLIALAFISNAFLLRQNPFYLFTFLLQSVLLLSPLIDWLLRSLGIHLILLRFASYFIMMNIALAKGFVMYLRGIDTNIWSPTERNVD